MQHYFDKLLSPHSSALGRNIWFHEEARAERLTNLIRIGFSSLWLLATVPAIHLHPFFANLSNIGMGIIWLVFAITYQRYLLNNPYTEKLKYLSTSADIFIITSILFFYSFDLGYSISLKAPPFIGYMLVLPLTAFRFSKALTLYGGVGCIVAYACLFLYLQNILIFFLIDILLTNMLYISIQLLFRRYEFLQHQ